MFRLLRIKVSRVCKRCIGVVADFYKYRISFLMGLVVVTGRKLLDKRIMSVNC